MRTSTGKEASSSDSIGLQGLQAMLYGKCCSSDLLLLFSTNAIGAVFLGESKMFVFFCCCFEFIYLLE